MRTSGPVYVLPIYLGQGIWDLERYERLVNWVIIGNVEWHGR